MTSLFPLHAHHWLPVVGYAGRYEVSRLGVVRSVHRTVRKSPANKASFEHVIPERVLRQHSRSGYPSVCLYLDGKGTTHLVHRLVAEAFIGTVPDGMMVCHADGSRWNNRVDNLRIDTPANNSADMGRHGTLLLGEKNHLSKLTEADVRAIRALAGAMSQRQLGDRFGVTKQAIGFVLRRQVWRHVA